MFRKFSRIISHPTVRIAFEVQYDLGFFECFVSARFDLPAHLNRPRLVVAQKRTILSEKDEKQHGIKQTCQRCHPCRMCFHTHTLSDDDGKQHKDRQAACEQDGSKVKIGENHSRHHDIRCGRIIKRELLVPTIQCSLAACPAESDVPNNALMSPIVLLIKYPALAARPRSSSSLGSR